MEAERGPTGVDECVRKSAEWQGVSTSQNKSQGMFRARESQ